MLQRHISWDSYLYVFSYSCYFLYEAILTSYSVSTWNKLDGNEDYSNDTSIIEQKAGEGRGYKVKIYVKMYVICT